MGTTPIMKKFAPGQNSANDTTGRSLLTVVELAGILSIRPQTIYNKMSQGLFPIKHKKIGRLVRFDSRELDRYLDSLPDHR
jgi:predicted DNA-binding transcriptional regulator AlpA